MFVSNSCGALLLWFVSCRSGSKKTQVCLGPFLYYIVTTVKCLTSAYTNQNLFQDSRTHIIPLCRYIQQVGTFLKNGEVRRQYVSILGEVKLYLRQYRNFFKTTKLYRQILAAQTPLDLMNELLPRANEIAAQRADEFPPTAGESKTDSSAPRRTSSRGSSHSRHDSRPASRNNRDDATGAVVPPLGGLNNPASGSRSTGRRSPRDHPSPRGRHSPRGRQTPRNKSTPRRGGRTPRYTPRTPERLSED